MAAYAAAGGEVYIDAAIAYLALVMLTLWRYPDDVINGMPTPS
jgi:hypothetical protein